MRYIVWFPVCVLALHLRYSTGKMYDVYILRTELIELNPKYVRDWNVYIHRHNRTAPYTFMANLTILQPLYSNASINIIAKELRSNEYREAGLSISGTVCEWLKTDKVLYPMLRKFGNLPERCPVVGNILVKDLWVPSNILPTFIPFGDARMDLNVFTTHSKELIFKAYVCIKVVERARRISPKKKQNK